MTVCYQLLPMTAGVLSGWAMNKILMEGLRKRYYPEERWLKLRGIVATITGSRVSHMMTYACKDMGEAYLLGVKLGIFVSVAMLSHAQAISREGEVILDIGLQPSQRRIVRIDLDRDFLVPQVPGFRILINCALVASIAVGIFFEITGDPWLLSVLAVGASSYAFSRYLDRVAENKEKAQLLLDLYY